MKQYFKTTIFKVQDDHVWVGVENELNTVAVVQVDVDENGNPIFDTINVAPSMRTAGAIASNTFFSRFEVGGSHEGYLSDAEKKLIAEWLDVGAQYYNNPFDVPIN